MTATTANRAKSNSYLTKLSTRPIYKSSPQAGLILPTELRLYVEKRRAPHAQSGKALQAAVHSPCFHFQLKHRLVSYTKKSVKWPFVSHLEGLIYFQPVFLKLISRLLGSQLLRE